MPTICFKTSVGDRALIEAIASRALEELGSEIFGDDPKTQVAELAACNSYGCDHHGIGRLEPDHHGRQGLLDAPPDTVFDVLSEETVSEITEEKDSHD